MSNSPEESDEFFEYHDRNANEVEPETDFSETTDDELRQKVQELI